MSDTYKIFVTNVISPDKFFAKIGSEEFFIEFGHFEERCEDLAKSIDSERKAEAIGYTDINELVQDQWVLAFSSLLKCWRRARVNMVAADEVDVNFVDYEFTEMVAVENIITAVPKWVSDVEPLVFKCKLTGIRPIAKTYISRATTFLTDLVQCKLLDGRVLVSDETVGRPYPIEIFVRDVESDVVSVSDLLKEEGLAMELTAEKKPSGEQGRSNTNSPHQVPDFDFNQLIKKETNKEEPKKAEEVDFEQKIFTKNLGQPYQQHQDSKIHPLRDPGDSPISGEKFMFSGINKQLSEMRNANSKTDKKGTGHSQVQLSYGVGSKHSPKSSQQHSCPRGGLGRGAPPPHQDTQTRPGGGSSPSLRRKTSPKSTPQGRVNVDRGTAATAHRDTTPVPGNLSNEGTDVTVSPATGEDSRLSPLPSSDSSSSAAPSSTMTAGIGGPAPRFAKLRQSPKNHAQRLARRRNSTPDRDKLQNLTEKQKRTEYEWQSDQFCFKIKEVLQGAKGDDLTSAIAAMQKHVYPVNSKFENLPGKKELHLCIKTVATKTVEEPEKYSKLGPAIIQEFRDDPDFNCSLSEVLWSLQGQYVRVMTSKVGKQQITNYCNLLAQMFLISQDWDDNTTINTVVINTLDKWAMFNKKNTSQNVDGVLQLFVECLTCMLLLIGRDLVQRLPSETHHLFSVIQERSAAPEIPSLVKEKFEAMLKMRSKWQEEEDRAKEESIEEPGDIVQVDSNQVTGSASCGQNSGTVLNGSTSGQDQSIPLEDLSQLAPTEHSIKSVTSQNGQMTSNQVTGASEVYQKKNCKGGLPVVISENAGKDSNRGPGTTEGGMHVMTVFEDKAVQTEETYPPAPGTFSNFNNLSIKLRGGDKFERVREMLHDLDIEEFFEKFQEIGIRDTVLDLEFSELKDLLKECGVKPGQVLEIKTYLKNHPFLEKSESSSSVSHYCDTVERINSLSQNADAVLSRIEGPQSTRVYNDLGNDPTVQYLDSQCTSDDENLSTTGKEEPLHKVEKQSLPTSNHNKPDWIMQSQNLYSENADVPKLGEKVLISPLDFELSAAHSITRQQSTTGRNRSSAAMIEQSAVCLNSSRQPDCGTLSESKVQGNQEYCVDSVITNQVLAHSPTESTLHPNRKYDFNEIQNVCKDWLNKQGFGSGDVSVVTRSIDKTVLSPTQETRKSVSVTNVNPATSDYTGPETCRSMSLTNVGKGRQQHQTKSEEALILQGSHFQVAETNNNSLTGKSVESRMSGRLAGSPEIKLKIDKQGGHSVNTVVSPSSYMPPTPQGASVSPEILFQTEAYVTESPTFLQREEPTQNLGVAESLEETTTEGFEIKEESEEERKGVVLSPISQRIAEFGQQQPMCSLCGQRGTHRSHECPDKMKKLFL